MTYRRPLLPIALASLLAVPGCDEPPASGAPATEPEATAAAPADDEVRPPPSGRALTEDGEEIIFSGRGAATKAPARREIDRSHLVLEPTSPDPEAGEFTLEEAVVGMPIDGQLVAEIGTDLGTLLCDLYADRAPRAVASFIGLARGNRPWWDARAGSWRTEPYYRGLTFFRVIPGFIVQAGDYLEDGSGRVGFTLPPERPEGLLHDRAGLLAMATINNDPATGAAQFYITDGAAPSLDGTATIFGHCMPEDLVSRIARVVQSGDPENRPLTDVPIRRVLIQRVDGGAANARPTAPRLPPGEPEVGRGASPGPSELRARMREAAGMPADDPDLTPEEMRRRGALGLDPRTGEPLHHR
jgi:peptidyl-prolyl cis-trans isomerase A (cyclophilin A)